MNNEKRTKNNLLYAVLGILVLIVSVTGATFAYYTATATYNGGTITGNMATITFSLQVTKMTNVDVENNRGLIPMSNAMVQKAVSNASNNGICLDDNKNAACQIYKITVNNTGTAGMFLDGYVTLSGGSGVSTDWTSATTTMRWAQVFETSVQKVSADTKDKDTNNDGVCQTTQGDNPVTPNVKETTYVEEGCVNQTVSAYSTAGTQNLGLISNDGIEQAGVTFTSIGNLLVGKNDINIRTANSQALLIVGDIDEDEIRILKNFY